MESKREILAALSHSPGSTSLGTKYISKYSACWVYKSEGHGSDPRQINGQTPWRLIFRASAHVHKCLFARRGTFSVPPESGICASIIVLFAPLASRDW
jgi:hypothetical protein